MQYTILLSKNENTKEVEAEEQTRFVLSILEALEIPFKWDSNEPFSIFDKIRLRKTLTEYNISVIDDMDGGLQIHLNNTDLLGEWKKCQFKLKEDLTQKSPDKRYYLEMYINFWSIFEKQE